jgi:dihydroorotate dehydrogenase electron transfer subunit
MSSPRMHRIAENHPETPTIRTIRFRDRMEALPGQFVMVWVPGVDEFPMSLSHIGDDFGFTYKVVGDGTRALVGLGEGDLVGIRGPYGVGYGEMGRHLLAVAGGTGTASLAPFIEQALAMGTEPDIVIGARTAEELLFEERCSEAGARVHIATDDGTRGFRGFAAELARKTLESGSHDQVVACGPEMMVKGVLDIARERNLPMEASLERHMKCGIGICDSCALDGKHVCTDGPVFPRSDLEAFEDLGRCRLDISGRRVDL